MRRSGGSLGVAAQGAARAAENPAFGYDKRLTAVVSPGGKLVRSYTAESALLQATGACHAGRPATVCNGLREHVLEHCTGCQHLWLSWR